MRKILFLLPAIALSACADGPSLQSRMAALTGASEQTVIQQLGVPDKQITVKDTQYLAYERHQYDYSPIDDTSLQFVGGFGGGFYGGPLGGPILIAATPPAVADDQCETTFTLKDDKVVSFTLRGDDCS